MSQTNADIVRTYFEAFDRGDLRGAAGFLDPDVEWDNTVLIDEGVIRGREAVKTYRERILSTTPFAHEDHRFVELGDKVCVLANVRAHGTGSGIEVAHPCGYALTLREGAIIRSLFYFDQSQARQAVGLEGEAMSQENVEVVEQALDAYTRRDVEALRALADPNMELDWSASRGSLADVYRGIDDSLRFYAGYFEAFDEIVIVPDRLIEAATRSSFRT